MRQFAKESLALKQIVDQWTVSVYDTGRTKQFSVVATDSELTGAIEMFGIITNKMVMFRMTQAVLDVPFDKIDPVRKLLEQVYLLKGSFTH